MTELLPYTCDLARAMIFIDGENLAIRYANILKQRNEAQRPDVRFLPNTYVWPRVDITLATDMLLHATRKHYDVAVLVAGDEDYVPLVRAVQGEGARVYVWFLPDGLSLALQMAADYYVDLDEYMFNH